MVTIEKDTTTDQRSAELAVYVDALGAQLYGVASAEMYEEHFPAKPSPRQFVPKARSVVIIGMPFTRGVMTTVLKHELAGLRPKPGEELSGDKVPVRGAERFFLDPENDMLDHEVALIAYKIARYVEGKGYSAMHLPTEKKSDRRFWTAPFYHMPAMYLAGLGTMGLNASIITPEYGPRVWVTSVITDMELRPGRPMTEDVCTSCGLCVENCPVSALDGEGWKDVYKCSAYGCCATCIAICPVGEGAGC